MVFHPGKKIALQLVNDWDVYVKSQADTIRKTFSCSRLQIKKLELSYIPAFYEFDKN